MAEDQATFLKIALVFVGAGTGGLLRYWLGGLIQNWWGPDFPLGTLVVNVSGCLAMGFLAAAWMGTGSVRDEIRCGMLIGLLGGYTTFSSFGRETLELIQNNEWLRAGAYIFASVMLSLLAVWLGAIIASKLVGSGTP